MAGVEGLSDEMDKKLKDFDESVYLEAKKAKDEIEALKFITCTSEKGEPVVSREGITCTQRYDTRLVYDDLCPNCYPSVTIAKWECQKEGCGKINKGGRTYCSNSYCKALAPR